MMSAHLTIAVFDRRLRMGIFAYLSYRIAGLLIGMLFVVGISVRAEDFLCVTNAGSINITGYTGAGGEVIIPDNISGMPVTTLHSFAFYRQTNVTSIAIPSNLTEIQSSTFEYCDNLASVTIGDGVVDIGNYAFHGCSKLSVISIPQSVAIIRSGAFFDCPNLTHFSVDGSNADFSSVDGVLFDKSQANLISYPGGRAGGYVVPESVVTIGTFAFTRCTKVTEVAIGPDVTFIDGFAFYGCTSLTNITVDLANTSYGSVDGVLFDKPRVELILCPGGRAGGYTIPESVESIGSRAFGFCTGLTSVTIPAGVSSIGLDAFDLCENLTNITVEVANSSYGSVDGVLFDKTGATLLQSPEGKDGPYAIPNSVTIIGDNAFRYCSKLTSVTVPGTVNTIGSFAFSFCRSLTNITVDAANTSFSSVDGVLFDKSQATLIVCPGGRTGAYTVPESVNTILNSAFQNCTKLTSVTIGDEVSNVGDNAFDRCSSLTAVRLGTGLTSIGSYAFSDCANLTSLTIPESVTFIGGYAFHGDSSLAGIYFMGNAPFFALTQIPQDNNVIYYYLPGTSGWETTLAGRPAVLWNPKPEISSPTDPFAFTITGSSNLVIVVERADSLTNPAWTPVSTNTLSDGSSTFSDPQSMNHPARFYRLRSPH